MGTSSAQNSMLQSRLALAALLLLLLVQSSYSAFELTPDVPPIQHHHRKAGDGQLWVGITIVSSALASATGGVCLDGSAPAYHLLKGSGSGAKSWHLHLEGGAWCESIEKCVERASTNLGSSSKMETSIPFTGLLNNNYNVNPDFYNWNHVYVRYCDGSSFNSDVANPYKTSSGQTLYFRGRKAFKAIIDDLKSQGLGNADQAFLTGCSAGGLSTIHRCNDFQYYLPGIKVKCLSDGGFFLNAPDTSGNYALYSFYNGVVNTHSLKDTLPSSCISSKDATQCFFPQNMQNYVGPPLFFVNGAYDFWQLENVKRLSRDQYSSCVDHSACPNVNVLQGFRQSMLDALSVSRSRGSSGMFIDSCFSHCQVQGDDKWNNPKVNGLSTAKTVGDWYFGRSSSSIHIDCAYPCNPTCVTRLD
ncbi:hypothetical protein SELMODRAFT_272264 [Selaginella moellendorffii]|uniref:Pectin acetylesterase n=1 Tax=Selaginella moellendorffii TaxID=88036 RepID=D8T9R7_SELML|nr:pectin acetylesterase 8 [Selaginella moellendorffii]XP_024521774.1 pectin acetylesterase 8 [Selaginella moellendorffii]EFJ06601.1 hypothetical protein SELMODRAFT_272264 [Selaginella moellendorffii]|eukprot:XP_002992325.1 pectin acetylesterase 8 [Selaginella moellendorffii]